MNDDYIQVATTAQMLGGSSTEVDPSRQFEEQMADKKDLVEQCIKSDQYARETQGKLQVVAEENRALKSRVATVAKALTTAESEVSPPIYTNKSGPLIRLYFFLYSSHFEVIN